MDSVRSSMTAVAADLIFSAPPSSPMESKFWSRSAVPSSAYNNIKSEGSYTASSPMTLVNTNSSSGSCLASLMQVMDQSGKYNQPFTSDTIELVGVDQVAKCGFSTVTSTHRNQYSKPGLDNILDDSSMGLNTPSSELDSVWRLPYTSCWNPQTQRQEEFRSELPAQSCKPAGVCRFSSEISDDSSLDGCLPASSTVSSTSDGLADHEDDVYVDGSSTSVELPSVSNFTLNSPRVPQQPIIAFPSTCSESSTLSTGEIRSSGLDSPLVELDSRVVDQTLALGTDEEQKNSSTANLQLGNDGNILLVQPQLQDPKQPNDGQETPSSIELKWKHAPPALDVNENWSTKRLKPSPPSSPTSPAALQVPFPVPKLNGLNVNPPTPGPSPSSSPRPPLSPSFLMRNTTAPSVYQLPQHPTVASLGGPADLTKVPGPPGTSPKAPFMPPHQFLFGANFPSLVNIDIREIENSRPKRRNVKISKDPQSVAARHRRERISDRIRVLQRLVPGGTKMDTASMLDEAISYVKYLKLQVQTLESCGNAGFDPRMQFPAYYLPVRPIQGDCSTVSQIAPGVAPDHGMYGASLGQSAIKFPDVYREQFCH